MTKTRPGESGVTKEQADMYLRQRKSIAEKLRAAQEEKLRQHLANQPPPEPKPAPLRLIKLISRCGCERVMEGPVEGPVIQIPMRITVHAGSDIPLNPGPVAVRTFRVTGQIEGICAIYQEVE